MRRRADLLALFGYLLVALAFTFPLALQFTHAIPGDGFDGWQNYWNLWWLKVSLVERHASPYFTDLLYYPTGVSLLFHTLNPFNGLFSLPVQLAWGLLPAYNVAVLFSFVIGGFGTYLLARHLLGRRGTWPATFLAGLIFTFSPYHMAHLLGHLQLIALEWIPFYVLYVLRLARYTPSTPQPVPGQRAAEHGTPAAASKRLSPELVRALPYKDILLAALFLVLVALCDWYYVLYCLIFSGVTLLWLLARSSTGAFLAHGRAPFVRSALTMRKPAECAPPGSAANSSAPYAAWGGASVAAGRSRPATTFRADTVCVARFTLSLALAGGLFLLVVSPVLLPMLNEASHARYMVPDAVQSRTFSADLLAFLTPQEFHPIWGQAAQALARSFTATVAEHQVFAGYAVLVLAGLGIWSGLRSRRYKEPAAFWLGVMLAFGLLALGPVLHIGGETALLPGGEVNLPYAWLARTLPFLNISRSVSRFDVMVMLALSLMSALGLQWVWGRWQAGRIVGIAAMLLILFEFWPAPYPLSAPDTPAWYASLAADPRPGAVLNLPANWDRPGYLLYQTAHGKPLTAAYISRDDPRTLIERAPLLQHFRHLGPDIIDLDLAAQGQQVLAGLGIRWVVLDRYKMPGARERDYNEATVRQIFGAQPPVFADRRLTVYEVNPPPAGGQPYAILGSGWGAFDPANRSRSFTKQAEVLVQATQAGPATLNVILTSDSAPLDAGTGPAYSFPIKLVPGSNQFTLHAGRPDAPVTVHSISVVPG